MGHFYIQLKISKRSTKLFTDTQYKYHSERRTQYKTVKRYPRTDEYSNSGIYQMKFLGCPLRYMGQTGRILQASYKEHI
jgi:hypothetical protein